jgi:hypothetical protein
MDFSHIERKEYFKHMGYVCKISCMLFVLGVVGVLHGLFPFLFPNMVSTKIANLNSLINGDS